MVASSAGPETFTTATAFASPTPEGGWEAQRERERQNLAAEMLAESAPLDALIGAEIVAVERDLVSDDSEFGPSFYPDLRVTLRLADGRALQLKPTSHYYDGECASIAAVIL